MANRMRFYQATSAAEGKPARNGAALRDVLERVRRNQPRDAAAGPLVAGLPGDDWLALAAFYNPAEAKRLEAMLDAAGIAARAERERRLRRVLVRVADRDRALPIVLAHAADARDSSLWRNHRSFSQRKVATSARVTRGQQSARRSEPVVRAAFRVPRRPRDAVQWRTQRRVAWDSVGCICGAAFGPNLAALALWANGGPTSAVAFLLAGLLGIAIGAWAGKAFGFFAGTIECG